jgi:hypothetical protein
MCAFAAIPSKMFWHKYTNLYSINTNCIVGRKKMLLAEAMLSISIRIFCEIKLKDKVKCQQLFSW